jgi:tetratricopeptide (TPR) repeat protein
VVQVLASLKAQIRRVEDAINTRNDTQPFSNESWEDNERISRNLEQLLHATETFYSSASTIVSDGLGSTVWGGSIAGDPLSCEQLESIENWIPLETIDEDGAIEDRRPSTRDGSPPAILPSEGVSAPKPKTVITADNPLTESESDSDIEKDLVRKFEELASIKLAQKEYEKAELFLRKVLDQGTADTPSSKDLSAVRAKLVYACGFQGKWQEVKEAIASLGTSKDMLDLPATHGLHTLAIVYAKEGDFEAANRYCRQALTGKRKILGKDHESYYESLALRAWICDRRGDSAEAEGCRSFLPASYEHQILFEPLEYMHRTMSAPEPTSHSEPPLLNSVPADDRSPPPVTENTLADAARKGAGMLLDSLGRSGVKVTTTTAEAKEYGLRPVGKSSAKPWWPERPTSETPLSGWKSDSRPSSNMLREKAKLVVAVDYGTFASALAWAFGTSEQIAERVISAWPESSAGSRGQVSPFLKVFL